MSLHHEYTSTTIWILPFLQHLDPRPRNWSMSKEPPPLRQSKWGPNPEKSLIQESEKCIVMNANHSGGCSGGGLVFVIVLLYSVNATTLKIVLSWKSASRHHPDFDCTLSPTL